MRWLIPLGLLTAGSIFVVTWALESRPLAPGARIALAVVPVALWGCMIVVMVMGLRRADELLRRIQLDALAMAFPTAMMIGMLVEYLQKAGFLLTWTVGDVWPIMFLLYVPAYFLAWWRYR
jgi:hypothetical protein